MHGEFGTQRRQPEVPRPASGATSGSVLALINRCPAPQTAKARKSAAINARNSKPLTSRPAEPVDCSSQFAIFNYALH